MSEQPQPETRGDWQEDYASDTGYTAICPKCRSDDVDLSGPPNHPFHRCNSCGFKEDC